MACLRQIGDEQQIAPSLIANCNAIEQLVLGQRDIALLQGWRADVVRRELLEKL